MKKIISFVFIINLFLFYRLDAQNPITETEAKTAAVHYAQSFLQYKNLSSSNILTVYSYEEKSHILMREVVFDNGLSVLLTAYKSCLPVLLYSTNHTILSDVETIPDGLRDFIQNYASAISFAAEENRNNIHPDWLLLLGTDISDAETRLNHVYGPLLTTQWGQSRSNDGLVCNAYNRFINATSNECSCDTCFAGCVATAMAQIMKYWKYPVYMPNKVEQYDWCNMPDSLCKFNQGSSDTNFNFIVERNAIARLIADCGAAADMIYCFRQCESFTLPINARNAFVYIFDYHSDAIRRLRSSYSTSKWKTMIIEDLSAGRHVLYGGISWETNDYGSGGHAFVCDGYNEITDKFHFNWGHRGRYNNVWCTIDSIIEGNYNWNHLERAVFNIHPNMIMDYCHTPLPLEMHYLNYYNIFGITTPEPYENVPNTFTRLISVPNNPQYPSSWRTIPAGAISEYVAHEEVLLQDGFLAEAGCNFYAHTVPCTSCDEDRMIEENASITSNDSDSLSADTLPAPKSLQIREFIANSTALIVYPNPTDDVLFVELCGGEIANVALYDLQGRVVETRRAASLQKTTASMDMKSIPAGVYVLRVTDTDGKEYHQKIVRK